MSSSDDHDVREALAQRDAVVRVGYLALAGTLTYKEFADILESHWMVRVHGAVPAFDDLLDHLYEETDAWEDDPAAFRRTLREIVYRLEHVRP